MIGLAGAGDLVATALARESRNRRAGELLAAGVPAAEIPARIGQAVEALESVPLLARALEAAGVGAPVTGALGRLISGELPLDEWVALVRATVPPPARWRRRAPAGSTRALAAPVAVAVAVGSAGARSSAANSQRRSPRRCGPQAVLVLRRERCISMVLICRYHGARSHANG